MILHACSSQDKSAEGVAGSGNTFIRIMIFCVSPHSAQERSGVSLEGIYR